MHAQQRYTHQQTYLQKDHHRSQRYSPRVFIQNDQQKLWNQAKITDLEIGIMSNIVLDDDKLLQTHRFHIQDGSTFQPLKA